MGQQQLQHVDHQSPPLGEPEQFPARKSPVPGNVPQATLLEQFQQSTRRTSLIGVGNLDPHRRPFDPVPEPPQSAIDKIGFVDHSDGANVRSGPAEAGGKTVAKLPPGARVFVSGIHPSAPHWWYVTAVIDDKSTGRAIVQGYIQDVRITTDVPEPWAVLHRVAPGDTAEKLVKERYPGAARPGQDLRYYENVLVHVNQRAKRKGVTGSPQSPNILGKGNNNVQLVAGERIWLVSPAYADTLANVVSSGSLTDGKLAELKGLHAAYQGHIRDLLRSACVSPEVLKEVGGEYAEFIGEHRVAIVGAFAMFILAEATSAFLAATPTGVGQLAAAAIQLGLFGLGAAGAVVAAETALGHGSEWIKLAWTAKGDSKQLDAAGKEFTQMLVSIAMAYFAGRAAGQKLSNFGKLANSPHGLPTSHGNANPALRTAKPGDMDTVRSQAADGSVHYSVPAETRAGASQAATRGPDPIAPAATTAASVPRVPPRTVQNRRPKQSPSLPAAAVFPFGYPALAGGAPGPGEFAPEPGKSSPDAAGKGSNALPDKQQVWDLKGEGAGPAWDDHFETFHNVAQVRRYLAKTRERVKTLSDAELKLEAQKCVDALLWLRGQEIKDAGESFRNYLPGLSSDSPMRTADDLLNDMWNGGINLQAVINTLRTPFLDDEDIKAVIRGEAPYRQNVKGTALETLEELQRRFSKPFQVGQPAAHPARIAVSHEGLPQASEVTDLAKARDAWFRTWNWAQSLSEEQVVAELLQVKNTPLRWAEGATVRPLLMDMPGTIRRSISRNSGESDPLNDLIGNIFVVNIANPSRLDDPNMGLILQIEFPNFEQTTRENALDRMRIWGLLKTLKVQLGKYPDNILGLLGRAPG